MTHRGLIGALSSRRTLGQVTTAAFVLFATLTMVHVGYYPFAILFARRSRAARPATAGAAGPRISVIIPAYNEAATIAACLDSVIADRHRDKEIIVVDDGSTDETATVLRRYAARPRLTVLTRANGGKAAALNAGIARATGQIMVFADADGVFTPDTLTRLLEGFDSPEVGAVCGNDAPLNTHRLLPRLLALLTHVTSLVRRALSYTGCLAIVSGNIGAFRSDVVREIGGFTEGLLGEDLEITWRVRRAGYRVTFQPWAIVYAEVPWTVSGLWRQRVRWARGLVQTARLHTGMLCRPRYGPVSFYLAVNLFTSLVLPPVQLIAGAYLVAGAVGSWSGLAGLVAGAMVSLVLVDVVLALALDRSWRDLRLVYVLPAMLGYSPLLSLVAVWAVLLELRGAPSRWNKLDRAGTAPSGREQAGGAGVRRAADPLDGACR